MIGVIAYVLLITGFTSWPGAAGDIGIKGTAQITAIFFSPVPVLGIIIGWIYGKIKNSRKI